MSRDFLDEDVLVGAVPDKTVYRGIAGGGFGGDGCALDSVDGRLLRIRPMHYDDKYTEEELKDAIWEYDVDGKKLRMPLKASPPYQALAYKKRVYSKNRVAYPLKRVDWEPGGDPAKRNPQNRGKSKFKRISWDEALDIMESEIKRIQEKYGPNAVLCVGENGHKESKALNQGGGIHMALLSNLGGYTREVRTPDSVEGYYWGAKHVWGTGAMMGLGVVAPTGQFCMDGVMMEVSKNTGMIICQGGDPETTQNFASQYESHFIRYWLDLGKKFIIVDPFCNYTAVCHNEMKWVPILPNTDAAMDFGMMYVWITEDLYDKDYIETHTVGFDKVKAYVLGEEDGIPKTPAWASEICGVPEWTIKALARESHKTPTSYMHFSNGGIRGPYSHEPGRTEAYKLAMQGMGKPGVEMIHLASNHPASYRIDQQGCTGAALFLTRIFQYVPTVQSIPRTMVHRAILEGEQHWWGTPQIVYVNAADQFVERQYPAPKEEGGAEIRMVWSEKPCNQCCWNGGFSYQDAMRDEKIEFVVTNHQWLENDSLLGDLVLPVTTCVEEEDIVGANQNCATKWAGRNHQACDVVGESMSDYKIGLALGERFGVADALSMGMTDEEWFKYTYDNSAIQDEISWEELCEKGYYPVKLADGWDKIELPGMRGFYNDPAAHALDTPSGKIEFYSEALEEHFPGDKERGPIARWVAGGPASEGWTHDECLGGERSKKYPLLLLSNPSRWRMHVQGDDISWFREYETFKVKGRDGYLYEPCWIHPDDAAARGIYDGDIVKVFNERGIVLCGARVSERVIPNSIMINKGARVDPIAPHIDRGGSANLISPVGFISSKCAGFVVSGYLTEVAKLEDAEMQEWMEKYPEAFERDYDPSTGINFSSWVVD